MKAAFLEKPGVLKLKEIENPSCGTDEVVIRVEATGVCGSDLHYFKDGRVGTNIVREPHILGHESSGEVVEVGGGVTNLRVGDRVAVEPGVPCLQCSFCLSGRYNLCGGIRFLGAPPNHGTFCEYIAHKSLFVYKLPDNISFQEGAFVEPLAVGYNAVKKAAVSPGESVLISGAGTIGMACLQMAKISGAGYVAVSDINDYRLAIAGKLGADAVINLSVRELPSDAFDCVIEATGVAELYSSIIGSLRKGGRIVLVGMSNEPAVVDLTAMLRKEASLLTVYRYANHYPPVLELFKAGKIDVKSMISHQFPLEDIEEAFAAADDPSSNTMKIIIG